MNVPDDVRRAVESALGPGGRIESATVAHGGCINNGARIDTASGSSYFVKWNANAPPKMFSREAQGLAALRSVEAIRVPEPLAWGDGDAAQGWLLMEYIHPGPPGPRSARRLGMGLAAIHRHITPAGFGWDHDNWIGSLPQANDRCASWGDFWRDRRLTPQLAMARRGGHLRESLFDRLLELTPVALTDLTRPEMLHGDLWSGNFFTTGDGEPVLIDPAVYAGHGEVDLAMSELFGGFGEGFYDEYAERHGISPNYGAYRRELYQLYYLIVHVNLFGDSYVAASRRAAERVLAEIA